MVNCSMCHNDTLGDNVSLDRLGSDLKTDDDPQLELLSAIHAGSGTGLAADALVTGDTAAAQRKLIIAAAFCVFFMVAEAIGGYIANSLSIMTDAAHLLADLAGFLISVFALWLSARPATEHLSFGWYRTEIIGALLSIILIWVVTVGLFIEAFYRLQNPVPIDGKLMLILACIGLCVNAIIAFVLHSTGHSHGHSHSRVRANSHAESSESETDEVDHLRVHSGQNHGHSHSGGHDHSHSNSQNSHSHSHAAEKDLESPLLEGHHAHGHHDLNVRAAIIHAIGDMIQSIGVIIASVLIWYHPNWVFIDPICTFGFGIIVLFSTVGLLRECVHVLMEGAPAHINNKLVRKMLENIAHVRRVHDLHIWSIKPGRTSLSVHLEVDKIGHQEAILSSSQRILKEKFGITHTTIQVEPVGDDCKSDCG